LSEDGEEVADFVFAAIDHMPGGCLVDGTRDISTELLETATQLFQQRFRGEGCFDRHIGLLSHEPCKDYDRFDHQKLLHSIDAPENFATPKERGQDVEATVPLPVCVECLAYLGHRATSREALSHIPEYAALLEQYPEARITRVS